MFFRGSSRNSGAGLGLYLTKAMLEKINGKVAIESTLNHGTTFLLVIPNRLYMSVNK
jgi:signal transduction histidine kinase